MQESGRNVGRGQGQGTGQGRGAGRGGGRGLGGGQGQGLGGICVCPKCGHREKHKRGVQCYNLMCPKCNTPLIREG